MSSSDKGVREELMKFYDTHLDALLNEKETIRRVDIESTHYPQSISIGNDGDIEVFRLKTFSRNCEGCTFLENVYIKIT